MSDRGPYMITASGVEFYPLAPHPEDIRIEDIAHHLAMQCRFTGAVKFHYSVAQHSVHAADLLEQWEQPIEVQLAGLMHDAQEAYVGDWSRPLKHGTVAGEHYRIIEDRLQEAICQRFNLLWPLPAIVKTADDIMLNAEARDLMPAHPWIDLEKAACFRKVFPVSAFTAEATFLAMFEHLGGKR